METPMKLLEFYERKRPKTYRTEWYHKWVCDLLERAYLERKNVIFELPPRHGKSEIVNVYGPAWRLDSVHDAKFGLVANSDNLASKFSMACRNLTEAPLSVDRDRQWKLASASESLDYSYLSTGIRGQLTGFGFDTVVFDDLLKSGAEAKSDTVREGVWDSVVSAAINRLTPDGIIIALQARLHQQDTIGKLLELSHLKFLHLHLPATNSGADAWFRDGYSGEEVLFPPYSNLSARYSREKLDEIKQTVSSYYWNAQYMQVPSMGDLAYFDVSRFGVYQFPDVERLWIAVDAANTETKSGSYTAFCCLGMQNNRLKVLGVRRERWRQDVMAEQLLDFYHSMGRLVGISPEAVIIERAAAGYGLIDHFSGVLPVVPLIPKGSKEERAGSVCYLVNRGAVQLPESAPWLKPFKDEIGNFPLSAFKDQADAFTHSLAYVSRPSEFHEQAVEQVVYEDPVEMAREMGLLSSGEVSFNDGLDEFDTPTRGEYVGEATLRAINNWRRNNGY
jgi:predicted phage terminase large subunit-like protein